MSDELEIAKAIARTFVKHCEDRTELGDGGTLIPLIFAAIKLERTERDLWKAETMAARHMRNDLDHELTGMGATYECVIEYDAARKATEEGLIDLEIEKRFGGEE